MNPAYRLIASAALAAALASAATANQLLNERWMKTASAGDIREAIAGGAYIEAIHRTAELTPLMIASKHGNHEAAGALLEAGADPNRRGKWRRVPMHFAATSRMVALLADHGAGIDARSGIGITPLFMAAEENRVSSAFELIVRGADVNSRNRSDVTPTHVAAKFSSPGMVELLLDAGGDPTIRSRGGWFPAEMAISNNPRLRRTRALQRLVDPLLDIPALPGEDSGATCDGWTVRPGDTFRIILAEGVGDQSRWEELARLNGLNGRNMHTVGMCLKLPGRKAGADAAARRKDPGCDGYVVLREDRKLGDIAEKVLGDRNRWPEIADLNNLSRERPYRFGQCLKLPGQ